MSADHTPEPARPQRRGLTTVSVALAVLLAGGGGAYWASTASGDGTREAARDGARGKPSPLVLDGYGQRPAGAAERGVAPGEPAPGGGPVYEAVEPLSEGPGAAPAYRPAAGVDEERVVELAEALGVPGEVREKDGTWTAGDAGRRKGRTLTVNAATGVWSFTGAVPLRAGNVSEKEAREAAAPVVEALGLEGAEVDAGRTRDGLRIVSIDPRQDGLPVHGWTTEIGVGHGGTPGSGRGRLAELVEVAGGTEYPVMSAKDALAALNERSGRVGPGVPCAAPPGPAEPGPAEPETAAPGADGPGTPEPGDVPPADGATGSPGRPEPCVPPGGGGPVEVTGASFGLSAYPSRGSHLLVPSWLFEVAAPGGGSGRGDAGTYTVAHPAVEPEFLAPPSSGGDGATSAPADPGGSPRERVGTATHLGAYAPGDRTLTVHFWGGVCDDYTATAEEGPESVTVRITGKPKEPGRVCVLVAREMTAKVTLKEPVGDRKVLDEEGERLPEGPRERKEP